MSINDVLSFLATLLFSIIEVLIFKTVSHRLVSDIQSDMIYGCFILRFICELLKYSVSICFAACMVYESYQL